MLCGDGTKTGYSSWERQVSVKIVLIQPQG